MFRSGLRARRLATIDKAHFIYDHLIGDAREEIKYRPQQVREDPDRIFEILLRSSVSSDPQYLRCSV